MPKLVFRKGYFRLAVALLLVEVGIARYAHDRFIRPYAGDFLVVILLYCALRSFWNVPVRPLALWVLAVAYGLEVMQHLRLLHHLGWQHSRLASLVLGSSFSWLDMLCYTAGIIVMLVVERARRGA